MTELAAMPPWLVEALGDQPRPIRTPTGPGKVIPFRDDRQAYAAAALRDELATLARAREGERNDTLNAAAFSLGQLVGAGLLDKSEVETALEQTAQELGLEDREISATIRSGLEAGKADPRELPAPSVNVNGVRHPITTPSRDDVAPHGATGSLRRFALTEYGNAERLVAMHGMDLRHAAGLGWLVWDGRRWCRDETGEVMRRAKQTVRAMHAEAADVGLDAEFVKELTKHAIRSEGAAQLRAMVALAESEQTVAATAAAFDADPWLFNCLTGTVDLRTGAIRAHRREDLLTKLAPVAFDAEASCPTWHRFLARIFAERSELIEFMQRATGYSLTGDTGERVLLILYGIGKNGKSTYLEALRALLGDYAVRTPAETLLSKRERGIPNDVARLKGARFVSASETNQGARLDEGFVKDVTGGDTIPARFLRMEWFDFRPEFKLWLATNHKPVIRGTDPAIWDRVRLVPFEVRIPEDEQDRGLREKLLAEAPGILRWALEGCRKWLNSGLGVPREVQDATAGYRAEMDVIGDFLADRCVLAPQAQVRAADLYTIYKTWAEQAGERVESSKALGHRLTERGFQPVRIGHDRDRGWRGIGLRTQRTDADSVSGINEVSNSHGELSGKQRPHLSDRSASREESPGAEPATPWSALRARAAALGDPEVWLEPVGQQGWRVAADEWGLLCDGIESEAVLIAASSALDVIERERDEPAW